MTKSAFWPFIQPDSIIIKKGTKKYLYMMEYLIAKFNKNFIVERAEHLFDITKDHYVFVKNSAILD
jgi:hypothetical protein